MKIKLIVFAFASALLCEAGLHANAQINSSAYMEAQGDSVYKSDYFDMSLKAPSSWILATKQEAEQILNIGSDMVAGDNDAMKETMDASVAQSLPIMFVSRYPMSEKRADNINVSAIAENVAAYPWVKDGTDYLDNMKKLAAQSATPITFDEAYTTKSLGGVSFSSMDASIAVGNFTVQQEYLAARRGNHVIAIVATYTKDDEKFLLDGILSTITFD